MAKESGATPTWKDSCPIAVLAVAYWLKLVAAATWVVTGGAVLYFLFALLVRGSLLMQVDAVSVGAALGIAVGYYIRRAAVDLQLGEPSARWKAHLLMALHLLGWTFAPIGAIGLIGLNTQRARAYFADRHRQLLRQERRWKVSNGRSER